VFFKGFRGTEMLLHFSMCIKTQQNLTALPSPNYIK